MGRGRAAGFRAVTKPTLTKDQGGPSALCQHTYDLGHHVHMGSIQLLLAIASKETPPQPGTRALPCLRHKQGRRGRWLKLCRPTGKGVPGKQSFAFQMESSTSGEAAPLRRGAFPPSRSATEVTPWKARRTHLLASLLNVLGSIWHVHKQQFEIVCWDFFNAGILIWTPAVYAHESLKQHFWHWERQCTMCFFALEGRTYTYR